MILFSIGAWEQKLCQNKLKTRETEQQKKNFNFLIIIFKYFVLVDYIFFLNRKL